MEKIAKFEKVSVEQFTRDFQEIFETDTATVALIYDQIKLPKRATIGSAGYDFFAPIAFTLNPKESIKIPTGIRCSIANGWVLQSYPRSGLGFKYRLQLDNTVGIIDSDYYHTKNEGHIMAKISNDTNEDKVIEVKQGVGFMQGIFMQFGICIDDEVNEVREGGLGSTTK